MSKTLASSGHHALVQAMLDARKASGLTQMELAQKLKCQQSLIARMESGQRRIDAVDIVRWARAVGVEPKAFIDVVSEHIRE
ncbi:MAG: transcriptional regulator [Rhodobacterales bacterium 34-62-10]|nr:MAG: transcriptional regulator [Rhodobacterales bacterium 34-62-10]